MNEVEKLYCLSSSNLNLTHSPPEKMTRNFDIVSTKTNSYPFAHLYIHEPKIKLDMSRAIDTHKFVFDHVFDELASNNDVYQGVVSGLVDSMFQGGM